jgi:allantoicase
MTKTKKPNTAQRIAFANTKRQYMNILNNAKFKGIKMKIAMEQGQAVLKLYGQPDEILKLAKWAIDTHYKNKRP